MAVQNAENRVVFIIIYYYYAAFNAPYVGQKMTNRRRLGSLKVMGVRYSAYDFLFDFNRNHASVLYRFLDIARYLSKVADFDPPNLHLAPPSEN